MSEDRTTAAADVPTYTAKDFASDQDVRWCPGCGDYAVLAQLQRALPQMGVRKEDVAVVAGIGCSSRFPYYMDTFGFHGIHGRALAIASGLKTAHPHLSVWVATGDGDCLSIGGNHFIHAVRRNIDLNVMMFNNEIYGLTKGQYSPTSRHGQKTRSSPYGAIDHPFNPVLLALGAEGTFVARTLDKDTKHMQAVFIAAHAHKGISFMDILQNCVIFNDGAFDLNTEKDTRDENSIFLEHGQPLLFGKDRDKGIYLDGFTPRVATLQERSASEMLVHDKTSRDLAFILARLDDAPGMPMPFGIFLEMERSTYDREMAEQIEHVIAKEGPGDLRELLHEGGTWELGGN